MPRAQPRREKGKLFDDRIRRRARRKSVGGSANHKPFVTAQAPTRPEATAMNSQGSWMLARA
jgi:hypothetical protein